MKNNLVFLTMLLLTVFSFNVNAQSGAIDESFNPEVTGANYRIEKIGTTTLIWTTTDIAGNTNTCSFDVTANAFVNISDITLITQTEFILLNFKQKMIY